MATIPKKVRLEVYDKYKGHCAYCGEKIEYKNMQVDHIIPLRRNDTQEYCDKWNIQKGEDEFSNFNPSCRACNLMKATFSVERFREQIQKQVDRVNKYSSNYRHAKRYGLVKETGAKVVFYFERFECDCKNIGINENSLM